MCRSGTMTGVVFLELSIFARGIILFLGNHMALGPLRLVFLKGLFFKALIEILVDNKDVQWKNQIMYYFDHNLFLSYHEIS